MLLSGSKDKTLKLWDLQPLYAQLASSGGAAALAAPLQPRASGTAIGHAKDINAVVTLTLTLTLILTLTLTLTLTKDINAVGLAPNDRVAVSGGQDRLVKVWTIAPEGGGLTEAAALKVRVRVRVRVRVS